MSEDSDVEYEPEDVKIGPFEFSLTTIAFMPMEKLLSNQTKGVEISGQKVWCGSLVVSEYLLGHPEFVAGTSVVELGSGTGLLGMLCQRLGAAEVHLTDHDQRSLDHMTADVATNAVDNTFVHKVDWFQTEHVEALVGRLIQTSPSGVNIRLVAGDVLYKRILLAPFFSTVVRILSVGRDNSSSSSSSSSSSATSAAADPSTASVQRMLLCHVPRAGVDQSDVQQAAREFGLVVTVVDQEHWKKGGVLEYSVVEDHDRAQLYQIDLP